MRGKGRGRGESALGREPPPAEPPQPPGTSEATEELLDAQQTWFEPLTAEEKSHTIHLHTDQEHVAEAVADRIRQHLGIPGGKAD